MVERTSIRAELNTTLASKSLRRIAKRLDDRPHLLAQVADFVQDWQNEVWRTKGAATGRPWAPLQPSTVELKGNGRPLQRTGILKRALTGEPRRLAASVQVRGPEYGAHVKAGRYYSDGNGRGGNMPRRNPTPHPDRYRLAVLIDSLINDVTEDGGS